MSKRSHNNRSTAHTDYHEAMTGRDWFEMGERQVAEWIWRFIVKVEKARSWCPTCPHPEKDCKDLRTSAINIDQIRKAREAQE